MRTLLRLPSGRAVELSEPAIPLLRHYHVLHVRPEDPAGPPTDAEVDQILLLATRVARALGRRHLGDPECFSVIFNGARTRKSPGVHVHIVPTGSVAHKRLAFLALVSKRWLRRLPRLRGPRTAMLNSPAPRAPSADALAKGR